METAIRIKKAAMFALTGSGAYIGLQVLGHGGKALETLQTGVTQQLQLLLTGGVAGVFALLLPTTAPLKPGPPPPQPAEPPPVPNDSGPQIPLSEYEHVRSKLDEWIDYGQRVDSYVQAQEHARSRLDTKQTVLRVSLFGIIGLALVLCLAGFLAPSIALRPDFPIVASAFFTHLGYLLTAFSAVGLIMGAAVFRVRVITLPAHAVRCALISSSVLAVSTMLVSLPYIFVPMWNQQITGIGITMRMLIWMVCFRLFVAPAACSFSAFLGFHFAKLFSR